MKRLLSTLALVSMASFAMPTHAAPRIVSKRQLAQPIPNSVLPIEARNKYQALVKTLTCEDTTYRVYRIKISIPEGPGPGNSTDLVITSATRGSTIKYHSGYARAGGSGDGGYNDQPFTPFACRGNGVYVAQMNYSPVGSNISLAFIPFASFGNPAAWEKVNKIFRSTYPAPIPYPAIVDGIVQMPGLLTMQSDGTAIGDSRPGTIEQNGSVTLHTLPWYRDLRTNNQNVERVTFYRLHDGYGVKETVRIEGSAAYSTNYYRIHDGESAFTQVDGLPITLELDHPCMSCYQDPAVMRTLNGVTLIKNGKEIALIHTLPTLAPGTYDPTYEIPSGKVTETATTYIVDYQIANRQTNRAQYWRAVIQK